MIVLIVSTIRREIQEKLVFRFSILGEALATTSMLLVFFLIDRYQAQLSAGTLAEAAAHFKTSYFGYVSLGLAVSALAHAGLGGVPGQFQTERAYRSLEYLAASPTSIRRWAVVSGFCNLGHAVAQVGTIMAVSAILVGLEVPRFDFGAALVVLMAAAVPMWCLALLVLSSMLVFRRGHPLALLITTAFDLLGGVYVPPSVLPDWLARFGEALPITPAIRAMQAVVHQGASLGAVVGDLGKLAAMSAIYLPVALLLLSWADRSARRNGVYCLS